MEFRKISELSEHWKNAEIYNKMDTSDIESSIEMYGFLEDYPIIITSEGTILSGHRRFRACKNLGIEEVPVKIKDFDEEWEELQFLLIANAQRVKTIGDRVREGWLYEQIESEKAEKRMKAGVKSDPEPNLAQGNNKRLPQTRDIVSKKIGMKHSTYDAASKLLENLYTFQDVDGKTIFVKTNSFDFVPAEEREKISFYDALLSLSVAGSKRAYEGGLYEDLKKNGHDNLIQQAINGEVKLKELEEEGSEDYHKASAAAEVRRRYDERTGSDYKEKQELVSKKPKTPTLKEEKEEVEDVDYGEQEDPNNEHIDPKEVKTPSVLENTDFDEKEFADKAFEDLYRMVKYLPDTTRSAMEYFHMADPKIRNKALLIIESTLFEIQGSLGVDDLSYFLEFGEEEMFSDEEFEGEFTLDMDEIEE